MLFMTHDHATPPSHVVVDEHRYPVAQLIRNEDIHRLASLGVLRHITAEGSAPLGYTPWQLAEDAQGPHYYREPAGTPEERAAAVAAIAEQPPTSVSALQGMRAVKAAGLVGAFLAWKAALDPVADFEALAFLDKAQTWEYDDPILNAALVAVGATDRKADLFRLAATL
jgi:hypothetical protein